MSTFSRATASVSSASARASSLVAEEELSDRRRGEGRNESLRVFDPAGLLEDDVAILRGAVNVASSEPNRRPRFSRRCPPRSEARTRTRR